MGGHSQIYPKQGCGNWDTDLSSDAGSAALPAETGGSAGPRQEKLVMPVARHDLKTCTNTTVIGMLLFFPEEGEHASMCTINTRQNICQKLIYEEKCHL